jgi:hypothetical protein
MNEVDQVLQSTNLERDEALLAIVRGLWETVQHQGRVINSLEQRVHALEQRVHAPAP